MRLLPLFFVDCLFTIVMTEVVLVRPLESSNSPLGQMNLMRQQNELVDVQLMASSGPAIPAHRIVLAATSPYFRSMFTLNLSEAKCKQVCLRDTSYSVLDVVVRFCYQESIRLANYEIDDVLNLLVVADKFQISEICSLCTQYLTTQITADNVLGLRAFSNHYNNSDLFEASWEYIQNSFTKVVKSSEFTTLSCKDLVDLISLDTIRVPREETVYEAVINWVKFDLEERRHLLPDILRYVRLPYISLEYLRETIERDELLQNEAFCQALIQEAQFYRAHPEKRANLRLSPRVKPRKNSGLPEGILVAGGTTSSGPLDAVLQFCGEEWAFLEALPYHCFGMGACYLDGCLYLFGGCNDDGVLTAAMKYNLNEKIWIPLASMNTPRRYFAVTVVYGLMYAVGGHTGSSVTAALDCYNPETDRWMSCQAMSTPRMYHGATSVDGYIFAIGGHDGSNRLSLVECYDPGINQWMEMAPLSVSRSVAGVAAFRGSIYVAGGYSEGEYLKTVEVYDTELKRWARLPDMTLARSAFGLVTCFDSLYAVGGFKGSFLSSVETFIPGEKGWRLVQEMPSKAAHFSSIQSL